MQKMLMLAALGAAAVVFAVVAAGSADPSSPTPTPQASLQQFIDAELPAMQGAPAHVTAAQLADTPVVANDVVDLADAHVVPGTPASSPTVLAPTNDATAICAIAPGEMSCPSVTVLAERGAAPAVFWHADGSVELGGIATSGVPSVTVVYGDGTTQAVAAHDDVLAATLRKRPAAVRWTSPDGSPEEVDAPDRSLVQ